MEIIVPQIDQTTTLATATTEYHEQNIQRYYHKSTTNKSFIEMSNYLKAIGIKNYRFMLTLLDPDLAAVDPHDPNLPTHLKMKVLKEIRNNFWYKENTY